eukprot:scaffold2261_cov231-Pinguiococcus_pyrenoidosus.AAC.6
MLCLSCDFKLPPACHALCRHKQRPQLDRREDSFLARLAAHFDPQALRAQDIDRLILDLKRNQHCCRLAGHNNRSIDPEMQKAEGHHVVRRVAASLNDVPLPHGHHRRLPIVAEAQTRARHARRCRCIRRTQRNVEHSTGALPRGQLLEHGAVDLSVGGLCPSVLRCEPQVDVHHRRAFTARRQEKGLFHWKIDGMARPAVQHRVIRIPPQSLRGFAFRRLLKRIRGAERRMGAQRIRPVVRYPRSPRRSAASRTCLTRTESLRGLSGVCKGVDRDARVSLLVAASSALPRMSSVPSMPNSVPICLADAGLRSCFKLLLLWQPISALGLRRGCSLVVTPDVRALLGLRGGDRALLLFPFEAIQQESAARLKVFAWALGHAPCLQLIQLRRRREQCDAKIQLSSFPTMHVGHVLVAVCEHQGVLVQAHQLRRSGTVSHDPLPKRLLVPRPPAHSQQSSMVKI